jgi:hypothetical protein
MKTTAGAPISADMRVSETCAPARAPATCCAPTAAPTMRSGLFSVMARIMKLRWAARVHGLPLAKLLAALEALPADDKG